MPAQTGIHYRHQVVDLHWIPACAGNDDFFLRDAMEMLGKRYKRQTPAASERPQCPFPGSLKKSVSCLLSGR